MLDLRFNVQCSQTPRESSRVSLGQAGGRVRVGVVCRYAYRTPWTSVHLQSAYGNTRRYSLCVLDVMCSHHRLKRGA